MFNEHFVVYGIPSIVSAIGNYTAAKVEPYDKPGFILTDKRPATPKYKEDKLEQQKESFELMFKKMDVDLSKKGISITLEGNLFAARGIGASAASCVAVARALADYFDFTFSDKRLMKLHLKVKKAIMGHLPVLITQHQRMVV